VITLIAYTYMIVPIMGLIYLGMRNEGKRKDKQLARAIITLQANGRRRR
jgi:hypothetical protein